MVKSEDSQKLRQILKVCNIEQLKYLAYVFGMNDDRNGLKILSYFLNGKLNFDKQFNKGREAAELHETMLEIREVYSEYMEAYQNILYRINCLSRELHLINALELCNLFVYLLYNGYLSSNGANAFQDKGRQNIEGLFFADVACGRGVCLNYSEYLKDLLNISGYSAASIVNYFDLKSVGTKRIAHLDGLSGKKSIDISGFISRFIRSDNHTFTLVKENNGYYVFDATNYVILKLDDMNTATVINGVGTAKLNILFSLLLCFTPEERELLDEVVFGNTEEHIYSKGVFDMYSEEDREIFKSSRALFDDFYCDVKRDNDKLASIDRSKMLVRRF